MITVVAYGLMFGGVLRLLVERREAGVAYGKWLWITGASLTAALIVLTVAKCLLPRNYDDFPFFIQAVASVLKGELFKVTWILDPAGSGVSYLWDHFSPILALMAPLYAIWPRPELFCVVQVLLITSAAIPLWLICNRRFPNAPYLSFAVVFVYLTSPWMQRGLFYDFHQDAFKPLLIFLAFYAMDRRKWWLYTAGVLGLLLTKEDTFVVLVSFGVYAFLFLKARWIGSLTVIAALIYAALVPGLLMPWLGGDEAPYRHVAGRYAHLGASQWDVMATVFLNPIETAISVFDWHTVHTLFYLMVPLALLPLCALAGWVLALPVLAQMMFSNWTYTRTVHFHYGFAVFPMILLAAILGLENVRRLSKRYWDIVALRLACCLTAMAVLFAFLYQSNLDRLPRNSDSCYLDDAPFSYRFRVSNFMKTDRDRTGWKFMKTVIPSDCSISTPHRRAASLADRPTIRLFPNVEGVDHAFCDLAGTPFGNDLPDLKREIVSFLGTGQFGVVAEQDGFVLATRGADTSLNEQIAGYGADRHEAEYLISQTGSIVRDLGAGNASARYANPLRDRAGFLTFGCYLEVPEGDYTAKYRLKFRNPDGRRIAGVILVNTDGGRTTLAEQQIGATDITHDRQFQDFALSFRVDKKTKVELRVMWPGYSEIWLDRCELVEN